MLTITLSSVRKMAFWLCLLFPGALFAGDSRPLVTPITVERMLVEYGPRATVQRLTKNAGETDLGDYDQVMAGVAKGDSRWLLLVPRIYSGTDADSAESLGIAVAEALPKNPKGVLRLIRAHPRWKKACIYPMIEPTKAQERTYFRKAIPAVRAVRDPSLRSAKSKCLADLLKAQRAP